MGPSINGGKRMTLRNYGILLVTLTAAGSIEANRLRFILSNYTKSNLYACLRTHDCDPLLEAPMEPDTRENIYTENASGHVTNYKLKLLINNEETSYDVVYKPKSKVLQLKRGTFVYDEIPYNADKVSMPVVIDIDRKLDAHFNMDELYNFGKQTGMNTPNPAGYRPSLYLGNSGPIELRRDKNHFCPKNSECRDDLASLSSYVGVCKHRPIHDNLNPFCKKEKNRRKRFKKCAC